MIDDRAIIFIATAAIVVIVVYGLCWVVGLIIIRKGEES